MLRKYKDIYVFLDTVSQTRITLFNNFNPNLIKTA